MKQLEQTLQNLRINETDHAYGSTWHTLTEPEIEAIKQIFIQAGFKPPETQNDMLREELFMSRFNQLFSEYVGDSVNTNKFDAEVYTHILHLVAVAAGLDSE